MLSKLMFEEVWGTYGARGRFALWAISESERHELTRLRKENAELKTEREILRKASAYFAKETMR